jgi:RsiW-degrading membrane proteinase PrsW (M82 family)
MQSEKPPNKWAVWAFLVGIFLWLGIMLMCLGACTYSITMVHTAGTASDVVDETATATPNTSLSVPVSVIPK